MIINTTILTTLCTFYVAKLIVAYLLKIKLLNTILSQINRIHVLALFVLKIYLNVIHTCTSTFYKWPLCFHVFRHPPVSFYIFLLFYYPWCERPYSRIQFVTAALRSIKHNILFALGIKGGPIKGTLN
jgi:hypothetical protein